MDKKFWLALPTPDLILKFSLCLLPVSLLSDSGSADSRWMGQQGVEPSTGFTEAERRPRGSSSGNRINKPNCTRAAGRTADGFLRDSLRELWKFLCGLGTGNSQRFLKALSVLRERLCDAVWVHAGFSGLHRWQLGDEKTHRRAGWREKHLSGRDALWAATQGIKLWTGALAISSAANPTTDVFHLNSIHL